MPVHNIDIDGGSLSVQVTGSGPLIICSPGMGDTRDSWTTEATGPAAPSSPATATTADDLIRVAEHLSLGPAVLAGCSFSGGAATIATGQRADLIVGLVLLAPFLRNFRGIGGALATALMPYLFCRPWGSCVWQAYARTLWPGLGEKGAAERARESARSLTREGRWAAFQSLVASLDHVVVGPWVGKVAAPVLVFMGDRDPDWTRPLEEAEWVAGNFEDAENVVVEGVGHAPHIEAPEIVGPKIKAFMEGLKEKGAFEA